VPSSSRMPIIISDYRKHSRQGWCPNLAGVEPVLERLADDEASWLDILPDTDRWTAVFRLDVHLFRLDFAPMPWTQGIHELVWDSITRPASGTGLFVRAMDAVGRLTASYLAGRRPSRLRLRTSDLESALRCAAACRSWVLPGYGTQHVRVEWSSGPGLGGVDFVQSDGTKSLRSPPSQNYMAPARRI
jgi:hypothetical protein